MVSSHCLNLSVLSVSVFSFCHTRRKAKRIGYIHVRAQTTTRAEKKKQHDHVSGIKNYLQVKSKVWLMRDTRFCLFHLALAVIYDIFVVS